MPWVYILECSDGTYYTGSTTNLELRIAQHERGDGANYTKDRLPIRCVFAQEFDRIDDAFALEKRVQGWSHAKKSALIEGRMEDLRGLSRSRGRPLG